MPRNTKRTATAEKAAQPQFQIPAKLLERRKYFDPGCFAPSMSRTQPSIILAALAASSPAG